MQLVAIVFALTVAITVTLAAYVYAGAPYATMAAVTWCLAMRGWLSHQRRANGTGAVAFNLYIGTMVALMALYAEEWYRLFPSTVMRYFTASYPPGVALDEHAFVAVFPLTVTACMTTGALAYYRRAAIGEFAAWTVFSWGLVSALAVYAMGPLAGEPPRYVGGMLTAPIVACIALLGMMRLMRYDRQGGRMSASPTAADAQRPLSRETRLSIALVAVFIVTYGTMLYLQAGLLVVAIVCGAMIAGFVVWLRTTVRRPPAASAILPAYLAALALFLFHVLEEYTFGFADRIALAANVHWSDTQFVEVIVLFGPAIWIAGAIGIYTRHPLGNYAAWFFFVGMMLGEPTHMLVFPFMEGGRYHYFPGMWTALFPMVPAAYGIWRMLSDDRAAVRAEAC